MSKSIRLLLVDDHSVVRMGLSAVLSLEPDLSVVAEAEDGAQAVEFFRSKRPDVVLMDVRMPGTDGVATLRTVLAENPAARVLMLTTSELDHDIQMAMAAGAAGYLLKSVSRRELVQAIRQVHTGGGVYVPSALQKKLALLATRKPLSPREHEVLDCMRRGLTNVQVGLALGISEHTAKAHVRSILEKLESADRAEAVARGFELGMLHVD
jgi:two-component system NarL family response regulator